MTLYMCEYLRVIDKCVIVYRCGREWLWRRLQEFGGTEFNAVGQKPQISAADSRYGNMMSVSLYFQCLRYVITHSKNNKRTPLQSNNRDADNITHSSGVAKIWKILCPWPDASLISVALLFGFHVLCFCTSCFSDCKFNSLTLNTSALKTISYILCCAF